MPLIFAHYTGRPRLRQGALCLFAIVSCLALVACASSPKPGATTQPVWLTNQKSITILPVSALAGTLVLQQQIEGDYQGQGYVMQTVIDADESHFSLIALNSFGTQVFDLEYDDLGIRYESGLPIGNIKCEYLMADFQLCYFPAPALEAMISAAGLEFAETGDGASLRRTVSDAGQLIIEIERRDGILHYRNLLRGYAYHISEEQ